MGQYSNMGIETTTVNIGVHSPTPKEFLRENREDAKRIASDLSPFAERVFGVDNNFYQQMIGHNPAAVVISIAEKIAPTKEEYIEHISEIYAHATNGVRGMERIRWNLWLERMRGDDYGMILVGPTQWLQSSQARLHVHRRAS